LTPWRGVLYYLCSWTGYTTVLEPRATCSGLLS